MCLGRRYPELAPTDNANDLPGKQLPALELAKYCPRLGACVQLRMKGGIIGYGVHLCLT